MHPQYSPLHRFTSKIRFVPGGCWPWLAWTNDKGYGYIKVCGREIRAHRIAYMLAHGPIPDSLQVDHLCRNRTCQNPGHMELVTSAENTRRGARSRQTHCKHGHLFDLFNTYVYVTPKRTMRMCRACNNQRHKSKLAG